VKNGSLGVSAIKRQYYALRGAADELKGERGLQFSRESRCLSLFRHDELIYTCNTACRADAEHIAREMGDLFCAA